MIPKLIEKHLRRNMGIFIAFQNHCEAFASQNPCETLGSSIPAGVCAGFQYFFLYWTEICARIQMLRYIKHVILADAGARKGWQEYFQSADRITEEKPNGGTK
jgi:hypothetical protein